MEYFLSQINVIPFVCHLKDVDLHPPFYMDILPITEVDVLKMLGIHFDCKLTWNHMMVAHSYTILWTESILCRWVAEAPIKMMLLCSQFESNSKTTLTFNSINSTQSLVCMYHCYILGAIIIFYRCPLVCLNLIPKVLWKGCNDDTKRGSSIAISVTPRVL